MLFAMVKKAFFLIVIVISLLLSCYSDEKHIGLLIYDSDDTYIREVKESIVETSEGGIAIDVVYAENSQQKQNEQIEAFIEQGYDALIVNPVDRTASGVIIDKCKQNDVPLVVFNRELVREDMAKWDKVWYVGSKAEHSGIMAADIMADYWYTHPEADKNNDGVMQLAVIKGETGHQDTELRTEYFIEALLRSGISIDKLHEDTGLWKRNGGYSAMTDFLSYSGDTIEAVFANNDDMALGAVEALMENGYFNGGAFMPVVSIDGTPSGQKALESGYLIGTVFQDAASQGRAIYRIASALAEEVEPTEMLIGYPVTDERYVWIPYRPLPGIW